MTYKELVLKLLQTREELICLEDHLMEDFNETRTTKISFSDWCKTHNIVSRRVQESGPAKIRLKKTEATINS